MGKIKVAIIGVGNCASSLVQGVHKYVEAPDDEIIPGVMHNRIGEYRIEDIEVVAAFDVDQNKVGKDLSQAIFTEPNNTIKFSEVPHLGVTVERGMTHDGIGRYVSDLVVKSPHSTADISGILKERGSGRGHQLPAGGQRDGDQVVRGAHPGRALRHDQLHSGIHCPRGLLAEPV